MVGTVVRCNQPIKNKFKTQWLILHLPMESNVRRLPTAKGIIKMRNFYQHYGKLQTEKSYKKMLQRKQNTEMTKTATM
jgi:hypothetical protein